MYYDAFRQEITRDMENGFDGDVYEYSLYNANKAGYDRKKTFYIRKTRKLKERIVYNERMGKISVFSKEKEPLKNIVDEIVDKIKDEIQNLIGTDSEVYLFNLIDTCESLKVLEMLNFCNYGSKIRFVDGTSEYIDSVKQTCELDKVYCGENFHKQESEKKTMNKAITNQRWI